MLLTSWLRDFGSRLSLFRRPTPRRRLRRSGRNSPISCFTPQIAACVELLETRTLLSAVTWVGGTAAGGDLNWNNAANWNTNATPGAGDDVTIGDLGGATITVSGTAVAIKSLHTSGAIDVSGTSFGFSATSDVNATLRIDTGGSLNVSNATINGTGQIVNAAGQTLTLSGDTFNAAVENDGTLLVEGPGNAINGALTTGSGSAIDLLGGGWGYAVLTVANGFANHGLIDMNTGGNPVAFGYSQLLVTNGTLVNAVDGTLRTDDAVGSPGYRELDAALDNQGLVDVSQAGLFWRNPGQSTNEGTIRIAANGLGIQGGGLTNTASGIIDDQVDGTIGGSGCPELFNAGLFVKSGGNGVTNLQMDFFNSGTVEVQQGILNVSCGYVQTGGSTVATGGSVVGTVQVQGGAVQGNVPADYNVSGQVDVAPSPAPVVPANSYTQTSTGTLNEQIGGLIAGTQYGQIAVTGDVSLDGTLKVALIHGFTPHLGDPFTIINNEGGNPVTGTFAGLPEGATVWAGTFGFTISYKGGDGNDVVLTTSVAVQSTTTALVESAATAMYGDAVKFTATVSPQVSGVPSGTATFYEVDSSNRILSRLGTATLNGSSMATFQDSALSAGTHYIAAAYTSGDASFTPSPLSSPVMLTVSKANLSYTIGNQTQNYGAAVVLANPTISTGVNGQTLVVNESSSGDTNTAPAGTYAVTGVVVNGSGLASDYNVTLTNGTLTVLSAQQQITLLNNSIATLITTGVLNQGDGNALTTKLANASKSLGSGNVNAGVNQMQAFINQVNADLHSRKLTSAQALALTNAANAIIVSAQTS